MIYQITYEASGAVPGVNLKKRDLNNLIKRSWYGRGAYWHRHHRPKHFTKAGAKEYGYAPRKGEAGNPHPKGFWRSYAGQKQKKGLPPLVWSGVSQQLSTNQNVKATSKGVSITVNAPGLNRRNPHSTINMADEMRRISIPEQREHTQGLQEDIVHRMQRFSKRTSQRIG